MRVINLDKFPYNIGSRVLERATLLARYKSTLFIHCCSQNCARPELKSSYCLPQVEDDQNSFAKSQLFILNPYQVQVMCGSIASRYGEYMRLEDTSNIHDERMSHKYVIDIYILQTSRIMHAIGKESL